jgi:GntR family transcriptional regulator
LRTELELREHYGASRNTVRDAIKLLTTLGLVETRPGQGTFVVRKIQPYITTLTTDPRKTAGGDIADITWLYGEVSDESLAGKNRIFTKSDPQVEIQKANVRIANQLQVDVGSQVISRHEKRHIDGTPWSLQTSFYPMEFVLQGARRLIEADDISDGAVKYLSDTLKLQQESYRDWITVRTPETTEAQFFGLPQDGRVAVFEIFRTAFDQKDAPLRLTVTVYPTDRNEFIVNVGDVPKSASPIDEA